MRPLAWSGSSSSPRPGSSASQRTGSNPSTPKKGSKKRRSQRKKAAAGEEVQVVGEPPVEEQLVDVRAKIPAFRKKNSAIIRATTPERKERWEQFSRRKEIEKAERREKRAFYDMMKKDKNRMHSKKRASLLGTSAAQQENLNDVALDSDDEWEAMTDEGYEELVKKANDPLDRKKEKFHSYQTLHSDDTKKLYYAGRRGLEVRTKVRGKSFLLREKEEHKDFLRSKRELLEKLSEEAGGLLSDNFDPTPTTNDENMLNTATNAAATASSPKKEDTNALPSPEKVILPPL